jgi:hypothetical protein
MKYGILGFFGVVLIGAVMFFVMWIAYGNSEARLRNQIVEKQRDNTSQLDNTIKVISQNAQVTTEQKNALKEIIVGNADARSMKGSGSFALAVHEAIPNLD